MENEIETQDSVAIELDHLQVFYSLRAFFVASRQACYRLRDSRPVIVGCSDDTVLWKCNGLTISFTEINILIFRVQMSLKQFIFVDINFHSVLSSFL